MQLKIVFQEPSRFHRRQRIGRSLIRGLALTAFVGSAVVACDGEPGAEVESNSETIINGTPVTSDSLLTAELYISKSAGTSQCSGTVVADRWVLTAKHCLTDGGKQVSPTAVWTHLLDGTSASSTTVVRHPALDVGLVHVNSSLLQAGQHAIPLYSGWVADLVGSQVVCEGWGNYVFSGSYGTLRTATLPITTMSDNQTTFRVGRNSAGQITYKGDSGSSCFYGGNVLGVQSTSYYEGTTVLYSTDVAIETFREWAVDAMKTWNGCWDGRSVCSDRVNSTYFARHPLCQASTLCNGQGHLCGDECPPPANDELASALYYGTSGGWAGCRGNGANVCTEVVNSTYFINHPLCAKNPNCEGVHASCNTTACPAPTRYEQADTMGVTPTAIPRPAQNLLLLQSNNGQYKVWWQADGNLVLYRTTDGRALWSSKTYNRGSQLVFQYDGNVVIYNASGGAVWNTGTNGTAFGGYLTVQDDSNLVVYNRFGTARWWR